MFLLFLLGHRVSKPSKLMYTDDQGIYDRLRPSFNIINDILGNEASLHDVLSLIDDDEDIVADFINHMTEYFTNLTQRSFEDFLSTVYKEPTKLYEKLKEFSGSVIINDTKIFEEIDKDQIIAVFDNYSDFIKAANLDPEHLKDAIINIYDNQATTTISSALNQLGFDYAQLFDMYDKILKLFQTNSNYPITQFLKDYVVQPPSVIDEIFSNLKIIIIDRKVSYKVIENLILSFVKFFSNILHSLFQFIFKVLELVFKPISHILDFNAKNLNSRINDVVNGIEKLITSNSSYYSVLEGVKIILTEFRDRGLKIGNFISGKNEIVRIINHVREIANTKKSIIIAIADADPDSDFGIFVHFALNISKILKDGQRKMIDVEKCINELPQRFSYKSDIKILYDTFFKALPSSIIYESFVDWFGQIINSRLDALDMLEFLFDELDYLHSSLSLSISDEFGINETEFVANYERIAEFTGGSRDIVDFISTYLAEESLGSDENISFALQTVFKLTGRILNTISKFKDNSAFPFTMILEPISRFAEKYAKLFSKEKIYFKDLFDVIYKPLNILIVVIYEVSSKVKKDLTYGELIEMIPKTFIDAPATLDNIMKLPKEGYTYKNITLPKIVDCIVIGNKLKTGNSFNDVVPLKLIVDASIILNTTEPGKLTISDVCNAYNERFFPECYTSFI